MAREGRKNGAYKHGKYKSAVYRIWASMLSRTRNDNDQSFDSYGGRGIKVCERWHDFSNFYSDMGDKPEGKTLERIDNDDNYCPENCRWASEKQQMNNTRANLNISYQGDTRTLAEWCGGCNGEYNGIPYKILQTRLTHLDWSVQEAFETPVGAKRNPQD